ncbi:MAG: flavorubredoxin [Kiritimatiellia bacterium]|jgi:flavorubredoxin
MVTHGCADVLLHQLSLKVKSWCIEDHNWEIELEDRAVQFVFTPYTDFPGAFATFDPRSATLMSSDIFGWFTWSFEVYAKDEAYFDKIRPFHEHYMPSRDAVMHVPQKFERLPIRQIAQQRGSIVP